MKENKGEQLIEDLKSNPDVFFKHGKSHDLLKEYFAGLSLETLIPLLQSDDLEIQKTAIWIVSELASKGCSLLLHVVPLVNSIDNYIKYYALECVLLCATGKNIKEFVHLIRSIDNGEPVMKLLAMKLLANAEDVQLRAGIKLVLKDKIENYGLHQQGLIGLLNHQQLDEKDIIDMLDSNESLIQQYGAMVAKRKHKGSPQLIQYALVSENNVVKMFAQTIIDMN